MKKNSKKIREKNSDIFQMHGFADPSMNGMLHHSHNQDYGRGGPVGLYDFTGDDSYPHGPNSVSSSTIPSDLSSPGGSMD
jgi:hypothetical protein